MSSNSSTTPTTPAAPSPEKNSPSPSRAPPPSADSSSPPMASSSPAPSEPSDSSAPPPAPARSQGSQFSPTNKTHSSPPGSSNGGRSPPPAPAHRGGPTMVEIVFAAAGAAALLVILVAACVCWSRRTAPRRRKRPRNPMHYYADSSSVYKVDTQCRRNHREHQHGVLPERAAAASVAERHRRGGDGDDEHLQRGGGWVACAAARHVLRPARRGAGARRQGQLRLRGAGGRHGQLLGGEPAGAGRVRVRAQRGAPRRPGGGREAAQVGQRAGGARVPGRGGHHQQGAPPPPRLPRRLLHRRRPPRARLRVRAQQDPRVPPPRKRAAGDAVVHEAAHRARVRERPRLPARRLPSPDHSPRHQVRQHSSGQQLRGHGRGLRAGQAVVRQQHARVDPRHGYVRVPGAGVRVEREADGEVGRLLLRRDAAGAPDGAAAHRQQRRRQLVPGGQPRQLGKAGPVARAGRRRLRRRRGPEAAGKLRPCGDGAHGLQRRGLRAPLGQEAPQDEPDREGAGGGHVAGGPERGGAARAEHGVRHGGRGLGLVQGPCSRDVHVRHGADQAGAHGERGVQRRGHRVRPSLSGRQRGVLRGFESGEGPVAPVGARGSSCESLRRCHSYAPPLMLLRDRHALASASCLPLFQLLPATRPASCCTVHIELSTLRLSPMVALHRLSV